jgi:DNA-binding CsgD family transcriptional regulator
MKLFFARTSWSALMAKSRRLRFHEIRGLFGLIGECRELGYDCRLWQGRLTAGLKQLIGASVAMTGDLAPASSSRKLQSTDDSLVTGRTDQDSTLWLALIRRRNFLHDGVSNRLFELAVRGECCAFRQHLNDREWRRSALYREYFAATHLDDAMFTARPVSGQGQPIWIALCRAQRERHFDDRACEFLRLFHQEIASLVGAVLAPVGEPSPADLPPRLRQTLTCLLQGDSEKQVAARLDVSRATLHNYVTSLYHRLQVAGRGELAARFLLRAYPGLAVANQPPAPSHSDPRS